jgi:hypothetical protein
MFDNGMREVTEVKAIKVRWYKPRNLDRWALPSCYMGATWEGFYSAGFGAHRDSGSIDRSNFEVARKALEEVGAIYVEESHFLVGWVAWLAIHESNGEALRLADRLVDKIEDYPLLDENHHSALESEEDDRTWKECYTNKRRIEWLRQEWKHLEFYDFADLMACARGKFAPRHNQGKRP